MSSVAKVALEGERSSMVQGGPPWSPSVADTELTAGYVPIHAPFTYTATGMSVSLSSRIGIAGAVGGPHATRRSAVSASASARRIRVISRRAGRC